MLLGDRQVIKRMHCADCDSDCALEYDPEKSEDDPHYCAFCGEMIYEDRESDAFLRRDDGE